MKGIRGHLCKAMLELQVAWPKKEYNSMLREFGQYMLCPFCYEPIDAEEREKREKLKSLVALARGRFG